MFTQQANQLSSALSMTPGAQQNQALLQVFANCIQGLRTNGPVAINSGAGRRPPPGGVITTPPGLGNVTNTYDINDITNQNLWQYLYGDTNNNINSYPRNVWNVNNYNNPYTNNNYFTQNISNNTTNQGGNTANYFGGDTFYGDEYLTNNTFNNSQNFNLFNNNDYQTYNDYTSVNNNNVNNNNVTEWYNNQYTDSSYNDFSTTLETTQNLYNNTHNNFEGDSYFENVVNQGDVTNLSNVVNQGDVINEGGTYLTEEKVFITNNDNTVNLATYVQNTVINIINGGLPGGPPVAPLPRAGFTGTPGKITVKVPKKKFNADTCALDDDGTVDVAADFTPAGVVTLQAP